MKNQCATLYVDCDHNCPVYRELNKLKDSNNIVAISILELVARCKIAKGNLNKHIKRLINKQLVKIISQHVPNGKKTTPKIYLVLEASSKQQIEQALIELINKTDTTIKTIEALDTAHHDWLSTQLQVAFVRDHLRQTLKQIN